MNCPFFLIDEARIIKNYSDLALGFSSFWGKVRIDYSVKTNNEFAVLKIVRSLGAGLEVAAHHEFILGEMSGFKENQVSYDSPYKSVESIKKMKNIYSFNVDSKDDYHRLISVLPKAKNIGFRVNYGMSSKLSMADRFLGKFGVPEEEFFELSNNHSRIIGINTHIGSQVLEKEKYAKAIKKIVKTAKEFESLGKTFKEINLGGGIPSFSMSKKALFLFDVHKHNETIGSYASYIARHFAKEVNMNLSSEPFLVMQLGRSIVGDAGILKAKVVSVKKNWVFLDVSINSIPESIFFGQRKILFKEKKGNPKKYFVSGCTLNTADILSFGEKIVDPRVGDEVMILDAGAYSISRSSRFAYLNPCVYLKQKNGRIKLIRRAERVKDVASPME